jgi:tRNA threonylcarbamoyladenosine biosynthesis protein TsaB
MANILNIESSGDVCSVALAVDGKIHEIREVNEPNIHSKMLTVFTEELFQQSEIDIADIEAVAVSKGPGSYTGLRIGVSVAKGIAYGRDIPLISVDTLQSMACGMRELLQKENLLSEDVLLCPMIDARRMEVYSAFFDKELNYVKDISADIIDADSYADFLKKHKLVFFGSGAAKCKETLTHENAVFDYELLPSARYTAPLAEAKFQKQDFEDTAYFEPFYLKNFIAKIPTKNVYG